MWDEQDYFSRCVQGVFAFILGVCAIGGIYMALHATLTMLIFGGIAATAGCIRVGYRCARYAITGRNNINRDDF
jgi:hypothetical protein